jgi:dTDP-4-dehydrorhamnose reductase
MVGAMAVDVLERESGLAVTATVRSAELARWGRERLPSVRWEIFDAATSDLRDLVAGYAWVINAVGITKPYIRDDNPAEVERAVAINALFPHRVARAAADVGARVLQIATDCVYSGRRGGYGEADAHDALDVYGKTMSLGEVSAANVHNLRCSVVGPEPIRRTFLLEWVRGQAPGARIPGYTNQRWNGVTTLQFARICAGVVTREPALPSLQHLVPADSVTKAELLEAFREAYKREDLVVERREGSTALDRTLVTSAPGINRDLWRAAGYPEAPTVREMIVETARYDFRLESGA